MQAIKALGALLLYPQEGMIEALDEIQQVIEGEPLLGPEQILALSRFIAEMRNQGLLDLQEKYVELFDTAPARALHLFQHLYGDSSERGQAMVDMIEQYRAHGYQPMSSELPDYLPMFCEFAAQFPEPEARVLLGRALPVLEVLERRLEDAGSAYRAVFSALITLAESDEETAAIAQLLNTRTQADTDEPTIDEAWNEPSVTFSVPSAHLNNAQGGAGMPITPESLGNRKRNR